jgi:signal transduction histidine kinase
MKVSESGGPENLEWEGFGVLNQSVWLDVETWLEVFVKKERAKLKSDDDFSGKDLHMNFLTQKIGFASSIMRKRFEKLLDRLGVSASSRWGDMSGLSSGDYMDMVKLLRDDVDYLSTRLDASQRELSRERQRVSNAVEEKKTFIDVLRNELKASLNGMTSMLTLMKATELNDEQKEYATLATTASESMSGILSRLYDVVLLDSGHFEMKRDFLPLADVMKKIDGKWRSEVESRGLKFECRGLPEKDIVIDLDEERVLTLVDELMKNSVKKTAKGSIEIKCAIVEDHSHEMTLRFEVSDTGQGMEEDKVNLLFREFSKQELFGSRQFESMGIGLSLCHKLVHAMGGKMGVYSEIGKGSRFWFILKVKKFKEEVEDISPKSNEDVGGQDPHSTKGMEVLLIDDNPISRKVLVQQLERMGMNIEVSGSSFTGLELLQSQPYALLVLGMSMPDMNAFDLVLRLKESLSESDMKMPVILGLAKNPHADLRVKCLEVGMCGLLGKPLPSNDLKSFLSEHF